MRNFRANRRGYWSLWIFLAIFIVTLFAEFIANDRPILVSYKGEWLYPIFVDYPEEKFGGFLPVTDYRDPVVADEIAAHGFAIWPPIRFSYDTHDLDLPTPAPSPPTWMLKDSQCRTSRRGSSATRGAIRETLGCRDIEWDWLGTDDQGRDVVARLIYGFRLSVLFGLVLAIASSVIGVAAGALQGYFGGWTDLLFQRFIDIWTSVPQLYLLIIVSSFIAPSFFVLLAILLLFSWVVARRRGARRIPAGAQFRICARGSRARLERPQDHAQARAAERHGGDAHLPALHPQRLDLDLDLARFPRLRPAAGLPLARRASEPGQIESSGALARALGLHRDRDHAVAA